MAGVRNCGVCGSKPGVQRTAHPSSCPNLPKDFPQLCRFTDCLSKTTWPIAAFDRHLSFAALVLPGTTDSLRGGIWREGRSRASPSAGYGRCEASSSMIRQICGCEDGLLRSDGFLDLARFERGHGRHGTSQRIRALSITYRGVPNSAARRGVSHPPTSRLPLCVDPWVSKQHSTSASWMIDLCTNEPNGQCARVYGRILPRPVGVAASNGKHRERSTVTVVKRLG